MRRCMMCGRIITEYTGRFEDTQTGVTTCPECVGKYMALYYGTRQRKVVGLDGRTLCLGCATMYDVLESYGLS